MLQAWQAAPLGLFPQVSEGTRPHVVVRTPRMVSYCCLAPVPRGALALQTTHNSLSRGNGIHSALICDRSLLSPDSSAWQHSASEGPLCEPQPPQRADPTERGRMPWTRQELSQPALADSAWASGDLRLLEPHPACRSRSENV